MSKNILIVDDDKLVVMTLKKLLVKEGYRVTPALGGLEAIALVKTSDFDLIISDLKMPDMDGVETIKKIREYLRQNNKKPIPEIFISAYAKEEIYHKAVELSAVDYLEKPFDIKALLLSMSKAFKYE